MIQKQKQKDSNNIKKITTFVYMQGHLIEKILQLTQSQLHSIRAIKKKVLNLFDYQQSQGKNIQLNLMRIYPSQPEDHKTPIFNQQNLKLIIDFLLNYQRDIRIQAIPTIPLEQLAKKQLISQQAIEKGQIHFDQNGSLIQEKDEMMENIPYNQKYDNSQGHVRCQFCQKNNQNKDYLKRCGGFYGPFQKQSYTHLLCALWCHQVFLDDNENYLQNVNQQIKRASTKKCTICKQKGAGLKCVGYHYTKKNRKYFCSRNYHFKCAYDSGCLMNWITFKMLCPKCKNDEELLQELQIGNNNKESNYKQNTKNIKSDLNFEQDFLQQMVDEVKKQHIHEVKLQKQY